MNTNAEAAVLSSDSEKISLLIDKTSSKDNENRMYTICKRLLDIVCSLAAIVVLAVPMLVVGAIIYIDDPHGSPFFAQNRVGKNGKQFKLYKLRSMYVNSEAKLEELLDHNEMEGPAFKIKKDPRITRVGRFIRKCSIDELPQLFNILRGDMSIVGPRPALPREVEQYTYHQKKRLEVVPGLTCFWQVHKHRNDLTFDEWLALDLKYIRERNLGLDLQLILRTFATVFTLQGE